MTYGKVGLKYPLNTPSLSVSLVLTVAKYAYTPFGYCGVIPNLPLCSSRSPVPLYLKSSLKNP